MLNYYRRIFSAYLTGTTSHLSFWHGIPQVNENAGRGELGEYYMPFAGKADYQGPFDKQGIPLLDYRGKIGKQYNPISIAQYGLGNYNLFKRNAQAERCEKFMRMANWLVENLEANEEGLPVWNHHFDWEYREVLKAPWYSALSQGQGISALARAYQLTGDQKYKEACEQAFRAFGYETKAGGVTYVDREGYKWFEEAIVDPPTHILNGFIWASWGVYDYYLLTRSEEAKALFNEAVRTLENNLSTFDNAFWSLYEQSGTVLKMIASPFYHSLHIVQLRVMFKLTGKEIFKEYADRWSRYQRSRIKRGRAFVYKCVFKLLYY